MNLTPRQTDVIVAIRNYRHLHGYSPTMQELADQLGTSKVTIFEHVGALEKKHVIRRDKHKARSLEIVSEEKLPDEDRSTKLPLLGNIAAGSPIEAIENREELDLGTDVSLQKRCVCPPRVRGESMIEDHLMRRRFRRHRTPRNGPQRRAGPSPCLIAVKRPLKRFYRERRQDPPSARQQQHGLRASWKLTAAKCRAS